MKSNQFKLLPMLTKRQLRSTTVLPMVVGFGVAATGLTLGACFVRPAKAAPAATTILPDAVERDALPKAVREVACNPCNPCNPCAVVNPCNPCNPCAAANPCNPCNPCAAANSCNPCNPCAAAASGAGATECVIPRLAAANPCNPCNPCAAANPCNPCNPCAAANPCNPCNPCAAANPCNPCNPCAAANPCNPCSPCNPCAAGGVEITDAEAAEVYDCVKGYMQEAYGVADDPNAGKFLGWWRYSSGPYVSGTHGNRYVMNWGNRTGAGYIKYEEAGTLPEGSAIAKDSFSVGADGKVTLGPLFLMEKMGPGFNEASGDWKYTMIMPDGSTFGTTGGAGDASVQFCNECHAAVAEEQDYLFFLPEEYRAQN